MQRARVSYCDNSLILTCACGVTNLLDVARENQDGRQMCNPVISGAGVATIFFFSYHPIGVGEFSVNNARKMLLILKSREATISGALA
jgi:hypothetical protein